MIVVNRNTNSESFEELVTFEAPELWHHNLMFCLFFITSLFVLDMFPQNPVISGTHKDIYKKNIARITNAVQVTI